MRVKTLRIHCSFDSTKSFVTVHFWAWNTTSLPLHRQIES